MADYLPWYKRLYYGIRYIIGKPRKFYDLFSEVLVSPEDLKVLIGFLQEADKDFAEYVRDPNTNNGDKNGKESIKES
jgi:hypothetical protein